jgi:outer membrane protein OmpA-like peptidoglycan-associated protein
LFFMVNGDKFSGRLMNGNLTIKTDYAEKNLPANAISRIEFGAKGQPESTMHLNNGSLFKGAIVEKRILVQPDFTRKISVCVGQIARIQFNTKKLAVGQLAATAEVFDSDSDGVDDTRDECPETDCGFVTDASGCRPLTDTDGDGVEDTGDQCPGTPAGVHADTKGCWVIPSAMFENNKATINPDFYTNLDEIARILEQTPGLKIEVQGHADNVGSDEYNLPLSQSRAGAVVAYLVRKGVDRSRLKAVGYGFSRPVASNATEAGRALNRRVELVPSP